MCQHTPNTTEYQRKTHLKTQTPPKCHESGQTEDLAKFMHTLDQVLGTSVELHKKYSPRQLNVYVASSAILSFVKVLHSHPEVTAEELKKATTFLAHSQRMAGARDAFDRFI